MNIKKKVDKKIEAFAMGAAQRLNIPDRTQLRGGDASKTVRINNGITHVIASARISFDYGGGVSKPIGDLREWARFPNPPYEEAMDRYNNLLGRRIVKKVKEQNPDATWEDVELEIRKAHERGEIIYDKGDLDLIAARFKENFAHEKEFIESLEKEKQHRIDAGKYKPLEFDPKNSTYLERFKLEPLQSDLPEDSPKQSSIPEKPHHQSKPGDAIAVEPAYPLDKNGEPVSAYEAIEDEATGELRLNEQRLQALEKGADFTKRELDDARDLLHIGLVRGAGGVPKEDPKNPADKGMTAGGALLRPFQMLKDAQGRERYALLPRAPQAGAAGGQSQNRSQNTFQKPGQKPTQKPATQSAAQSPERSQAFRPQTALESFISLAKGGIDLLTGKTIQREKEPTHQTAQPWDEKPRKPATAPDSMAKQAEKRAGRGLSGLASLAKSFNPLARDLPELSADDAADAYDEHFGKRASTTMREISSRSNHPLNARAVQNRNRLSNMAARRGRLNGGQSLLS